MKENSIKEDIILLKDFTEGNFKRNKLENYKGSYKMGYFYYKDIQQAIERVLSDYKRVLKENEELKRDRNNNYQMIALAQNEALGYIQGYEDGKKLKRSAVACVVENQQYYIIKKEIEHYKEYIEKLQKENEKYKRLSEMNLKNAEEFKDNMCEHRCLLKSENKELQRENEELKKFITEGITVVPHSPYKNYRLDFLRENFVLKKKIKNKIEELSKTKGDLATHIAVSERIRALQEILEESEDSKDGEN